MSGADFGNLISGQLGAAMSSASRVTRPTLGFHVGNVVGLRPKKQVVGVNAEPVVAAVADNLIRRIDAGCEEIGRAVRQPFSAHQADDAIAPVTADGPCPSPAIALPAGAGKETVSRGGEIKTVVSSPMLHGEYYMLHREEVQA